MKPSLIALGRYDEKRVRKRFLDGFSPKDTVKILVNDDLAGFYVVRDKGDHLHLDHLYILPQYQSKGIGNTVVNKIKDQADCRGLPIRLGALRGSQSNDFYLQNGFVKTHEDEFDIYYQYEKSAD